MKKLIFLFILTLCCFNVFANSTNFDFYMGRYLVDKDEEILVHFKYDLQNFKESNFLVRPVIENGLVEIYRSDNNSWVDSFSVIYNLPVLNEEMLIKIKGFEIEKTELYFQVFNISNGEIYSTPKKTIWSKKIYSKYLEKVNEKIFGNASLRGDNDLSDVNYIDKAQITPSSRGFPLNSLISKFSREFFYLVPLFIFFTSFFIGFKYKSKENKVEKILDIDNRTYGVNGKIH